MTKYLNKSGISIYIGFYKNFLDEFVIRRMRTIHHHHHIAQRMIKKQGPHIYSNASTQHKFAWNVKRMSAILIATTVEWQECP